MPYSESPAQLRDLSGLLKTGRNPRTGTERIPRCRADGIYPQNVRVFSTYARATAMIRTSVELLIGTLLACWLPTPAWSQAVDEEVPSLPSGGILPAGGDVVPRDVREMTERGLQ